MATSEAIVRPSTCSATLPLRLPCPRSPPFRPDPYGRHRLEKQIEILNHEISSLEEEFLSLDSFPLASQCCKEIDDFVRENADPLLPIVQKAESCWIWRILGYHLLLASATDFNSTRRSYLLVSSRKMSTI